MKDGKGKDGIGGRERVAESRAAVLAIYNGYILVEAVVRVVVRVMCLPYR